MFINKNIKKLMHMHIHDAINYKNHLPLGRGNIDIKGMINIAIKNKCTCVLETKTIEGLRQSVKYIKNYITNWFIYMFIFYKILI